MISKTKPRVTLEKAGVRLTKRRLRGRPARRRRLRIRARVSDRHTGVPPGVRGHTEVDA